MEILYIVNSLLPMQTELIDNFFDKRVKEFRDKGYRISEAKSLNDLQIGDKYLDSEGVIRVLN